MPCGENPQGFSCIMEDVGINNGQTIWNNGSNYSAPSFTEDINQGKFASAFGLDQVIGGLWNDITGVTAQSREFAQQEYLQDKMNAYNSPVEQMKRMQKAGINPNIAAAGIAGSGNESAQAPAVSSNTQGVSQGLAAASGAVSGIMSSVSQRDVAESEAELNRANARNVDRLADAEVLGKVQGLATAFESLGIPAIKATLGALGISRNGIDGIMAFLDTDDVVRQYDYDIKLIDQQIKNEQERWNEIEQNIKLSQSEEEYNKARKAHEDVLKDLDGEKLKVMQGLKADPNWDAWQMGFYIYNKYGLNSDEYQEFLHMQESWSKSKVRGEKLAENETIREKTHIVNEEMLNYKSKEAMLDVLKQRQEEVYKDVMNWFSTGGTDIMSLIRIIISYL